MNEIAKKLMCVSLRNGIEVWLEDDRATNLRKVLLQIMSSKFIEIDDQIVNTADITGIFNPQTMADHTRRKNGEWYCKYGEWHTKNQQCDCGELRRYDTK